MGEICNRYMEFVSFFRCQNCTLVDRTDLYKISKIVYGAKKIVTCCIAAYRDRDSLWQL